MLNLQWAVHRMNKLSFVEIGDLFNVAPNEAMRLKKMRILESIGKNGLNIIEDIYNKKDTVNILTHCNGVANTILGTATSPIYHTKKGIPIHVYADETRPKIKGKHIIRT